uniref:Uncharacterized protein n=1 Tax=Candidatus Kentrum sp. DK TaxID=2126562 RepID=A0A450RX58_9GAMM|nr:MAG: hypothetical protein BECKDK2373B_GA0170837_100622 [Candidatus Kentron sp. DK]
MNFVFHPEAEEELDAAIEYYEEREPGLGHDLAVEVYAIPPRNLTQLRECLGLVGGRLRSCENSWGVACHPWPLGPANPWRDDGTGEFSRTRLNIAYHIIPAGMPGPSARDGYRVWLRLRRATP